MLLLGLVIALPLLALPGCARTSDEPPNSTTSSFGAVHVTTTAPTKPTTTPAGSGTTAASGRTTTESLPAAKSQEKVAYLTFDDGPSKLTPELLQTLKKNHVTATFFVIGLRAQEFPGELKQITSYGNVIGVHSWTHDYAYIYKNTQNFLDDFNKLKNYIVQETGVTPNVCRFPGGTNNTVSFHYNKNHIMRQIVPLVEAQGFKYYDWNVSSAEASSPPPSTQAIIKAVVAECKDKNTAVILFHDVAIQGYLDALPVVIAKLRAMGFSFETLSPDNPPKSRSASVQFKPS